jgi:hypothetical protein
MRYVVSLLCTAIFCLKRRFDEINTVSNHWPVTYDSKIENQSALSLTHDISLLYVNILIVSYTVPLTVGATSWKHVFSSFEAWDRPQELSAV